MFHINDIKNGMTFVLDDNIYLVLEFLHVKPGKGPAFVRTKIKNLKTGATIEKTFNTSVKLEKALIEKKDMQYLYNASDIYYFMDNETYEQVEISKDKIENESNYLVENNNVELVFYKGELIGVNLPEKIEVTIVSTEAAVKGNTATGAMKDAVVNTGLTVKVPLFVGEGETIIISSTDGKYLSRN
ncbi:MAG: elongation factor P [Mollicutes bacterium]|nr:elongation factor P [Mollicutes bacterium]